MSNICKDFTKNRETFTNKISVYHDNLENNRYGKGITKTLYHATIDIKGVCQNGLKSAKESPYCALGIGCHNNNLISFTDDFEIAKRISHDLKTKINIANGKITPQNIQSYLDDYDTIDNMTCKPSEAFEKVFSTSVFNAQFQKEIWKNLQKNKIYNYKTDTFVEGTSNQIKTELYNNWRSYLGKREYSCNGLKNSMFMSDKNLASLSHLNSNNVGVVSVMASLPNKIDQYKLNYSGLHDGWEIYDKNELRNIDTLNKEIKIDSKYFNKLKIIFKK